jgi:stage V sporulation protein AC
LDQSATAKKDYQEKVKIYSPNSHLAADCVKAFIVGGLICVIGQLIMNGYQGAGYTKDQTGMLTAITLIFIGTLLTGLGVYEKIGKFAGSGSVVPITGFANSVAAPAIEFKKEGFIFGVGAKMFVIAGPVLVYGALASFVVGLVYYFFK